MNKYLAQNPFGAIAPPAEIAAFAPNGAQAIGKLIQLSIWILIIGACVYALFNFVLAGYAFMSAGDDAKAVAGAWAKIYQTAMGLLFAAGAFVLAAIFGQLIFGNPAFLISPAIPTI